MRSTPSHEAHNGTPGTHAPGADTILGRYRILDTNDEGGFGTVHACWDTRLQRRVAIKRMPLTLGEGPSVPVSTLEEALGEARTSSLLAHPNIVTVFDFEADGNDSYLVMEYVDGLNLADLLARVEGGTLSFDECAHVLRSVASALSFAHENGVLHLDIKPANIMIDRSGTVKLADFGMASLASAAGYGGARGGTIGYMPPEQIRGDYVDERSDVFSLSVVVYQALTGRCPFLAPTAAESLRKIERGPQPTLSQVEPGLAGAVEETLLAGLAPNPQNRMASVEDFASDIIPFLGDPQEGRKSLTYLLGQDRSEEAEEDEPPELPREPLLERAPWLPAAVLRATAAASCALIAHDALPFALARTTQEVLVGTLALAASGAAWPPLGAGLVMVLLVATLAVQETTVAFPLALLAACAGTVWWVALGRRAQAASLSVLVSGCLRLPWAGSLVAGPLLPPGQAFFSGVVAWAFGACLERAVALGFAAEPLARALWALVRQPQTWLLAVGAGLAALVCSLLSSSPRAWLRVGGELACLVVLALSRDLVSHMENAGIPASGTPTQLVLAVTLGVIMCIVTVLVGPRGQGQEGEVTDEERHGHI